MLQSLRLDMNIAAFLQWTMLDSRYKYISSLSVEEGWISKGAPLARRLHARAIIPPLPLLFFFPVCSCSATTLPLSVCAKQGARRVLFVTTRP